MLDNTLAAKKVDASNLGLCSSLFLCSTYALQNNVFCLNRVKVLFLFVFVLLVYTHFLLTFFN